MHFLIQSIIVLFIATPALAGPPPGSVTISGFKATGKGCEDGSIASNISPDGQALTLLFDNFIAELDPEIRNENKKNCKIELELNHPPGYTMAVWCVDFRGYAFLDEEVEAKIESKVKWGKDGKFKRTIEGPFDDDYYGAIATSQMFSKNCKAKKHKLKIDAKIELKGKKEGLGLLTVDSVDASVKQHYGIAWNRCRR